MPLINTVVAWLMKKRIHQIEFFMKNPHEAQEQWLQKLIYTAKNTVFGKKYRFDEIENIASFKERVPISTYESLFPYIKRLMQGEQGILWPTDIKWFAKSSGTTNDKSKFIPVSQESLEECHYQAGKDLISIYFNNYPESNLFSGRSLTIGGSNQINKLNPKGNSFYGDVSAVLMKNLPFWAQLVRAPNLSTALMDDWEDKLEKIALETAKENITSIAGVPTWTAAVIQKVLEIEKKSNILEVWPNLELFIHGAVAFDPYRAIFNKLIPSKDMRYLETYNATEGFFGVQDLTNSNELLLMLDHGIYYEFIPVEEANNEKPSKVLGLHEVEVNKNYALVISTNAGLWRYKIGDTVKFTSINPYRIKVSGRTKHFINAFGEELMIENAEIAIAKASQATNALINNFTAGPVYLDTQNSGSHEWIIEFTKKPDNVELFLEVLDQTLKEVNSDYEAKRAHNIILKRPIVRMVPEGTFHEWMKRRGKLGGQNKVPRLSNNREYLDSILNIIDEKVNF